MKSSPCAFLLLTAGVLCAPLLTPRAGAAAIVALKRGTDLDYTAGGQYGAAPVGGEVHASFYGLPASSVVNVTIDDTVFHDNHADNQNRGATALYNTSMDDKLFKFALTELPGFAGATINRAELRLWQTAGNNFLEIARNLYHDVDESVATRNHPTGGAGNAWGPTSNAEFGPADYGTPTGFDSVPVGGNYVVVDVTSDVAGFAAGTLTNLGWAVLSSNRNFASSEYLAVGTGYEPSALTGSDGLRPVLFLDFDPLVSSVPEPGTMCLVAIVALSSVLCRRRRFVC